MDLETKTEPMISEAPSFDPQKMMLYVSNGITMHAIRIRLDQDKTLLFGTATTGYAFSGMQTPLSAIISDGRILINNQALILGTVTKWRGTSYQLLPQGTASSYDLKGINEVVIGPHPSDAINLRQSDVNMRLVRITNGFQLSVFNGECFLNRQLLATTTMPVDYGDELFFAGLRVIVKRDYLQVIDPLDRASIQLMAMPQTFAEYPEDYPNYHRSPRIIYRAPKAKVKLDEP